MNAETTDHAEAEAAPSTVQAESTAATPPTAEAQPDKATKAEPASKGDQEPEVPESYEFTSPEGREPYASELLVAFGEVAKKHGLTQKAAQGVLDDMAPAIVDRLKAGQAKTIADWKQAVVSDPDIGGTNLPETKRLVGVFMDKFGTPELREWLDQGAGDNPHLTRALRAAGSHFTQDTVVTGAPVKPAPKSTADVLFGDVKQ